MPEVCYILTYFEYIKVLHIYKLTMISFDIKSIPRELP